MVNPRDFFNIAQGDLFKLFKKWGFLEGNVAHITRSRDYCTTKEWNYHNVSESGGILSSVHS